MRSRSSRGLRPIEQLKPIFDRASVGIVPIVDNTFTRYMLPGEAARVRRARHPSDLLVDTTIRAYFDETMVSFFHAGDEDDLAARIVELRANAELRSRLVDQAEWVSPAAFVAARA